MRKGTARPATQAGRFYTADAEQLRRQVTRYIESAEEATAAEVIEKEASPIGFVAPHAGYQYSGATVGHVYSRLRQLAPQTVFVLAPSHHSAFIAPSIWDGSAYRTPLGDCPIDAKIVEKLRQNIDGLTCETEAEELEHSLEVQIPFLQIACPDATLVPVLIGGQGARPMRSLADKLVETIRDLRLEERGRVAFVASSDGFHGYSLADCNASDEQLAEAVLSMETDALYGANDTGEAMACGRGPIACVLEASRQLGASRAAILHRSTSADSVPHQPGQWLVGYLSAMFS